MGRKSIAEKLFQRHEHKEKGESTWLVVPQRVCRDYRWIWSLEGYYDAVLVHNQEKDAITHIHYIHG